MTASGTFAGLVKARWSLTEVLMLMALAAAFVLGGSPNEPGLALLTILILSSALLAWALGQGAWQAFRQLPGLAQIALLSMPLLWMVHLVPLPPGLWGLLPGRELPARIFELIGTSDRFHPLSVMPRNTLFGLATLLPAIALFAAALLLDERGRHRLVAGFLVLVAISVVVGLVQLSSRGAIFNFYDTGHRRNLLGFFANRNHQGLMLAMSGVFFAVFLRCAIRDSRIALGASALVSLMLITAAVGSLSRAGLALTLTGLVCIHLYVFAGHLSRSRYLMIAAAFLAVIAILYSISLNPVVDRAITRYGDVGDDGRWEIWRLSMPLVSQYFPWGSGLGTFVESYQAIEQLDVVDTSYLNHAHNDYLEWLAEAGVPGVLVLVLMGAMLVQRLAALRARGWTSSVYAVPACLVIGLAALHSIVDYPLRTQSIAAVFGLSLALFLSWPRPGEGRGRAPGFSRRSRS